MSCSAVQVNELNCSGVKFVKRGVNKANCEGNRGTALKKRAPRHLQVRFRQYRSPPSYAILCVRMIRHMEGWK